MFVDRKETKNYYFFNLWLKYQSILFHYCVFGTSVLLYSSKSNVVFLNSKMSTGLPWWRSG